MEVVIAEVAHVDSERLLDLYKSVGWAAYTNDPDGLYRAVRNSTFVAVATEGDDLIGLVRGLTDDVSILYVQDILVRPDRQGHGIGRQLLSRCLERYEHVRSKVLMTDDLESQLAFYRAMGFVNTKNTQLNTFVLSRGIAAAE